MQTNLSYELILFNEIKILRSWQAFYLLLKLNSFVNGGVSERFKEAVLKTVELLPGSVGSNPTLSVSAKTTGRNVSGFFVFQKPLLHFETII